MNLIKHAERVLRQAEMTAPLTETEFSSSLGTLNAAISASGVPNYYSYIRSPFWKKRLNLYKRFHGHCQRGKCKSTYRLCLNHLNYAYLGQEHEAGDVELICSRHHYIYHEQQRLSKQYDCHVSGSINRIWRTMENL